MQTVLHFLKLIEENNNREWFNENKSLYEKALNEFKTLGNALYLKLSQTDNVAPPKYYRIYRDVRFSKNKDPYKTNFGVSFNRIKPGKGDYYFHVAPGKSFGGGGFWQPEKEELFRIRKELEYNPFEIKEIIGNSSFKKHFGEIKGEELKTAPKGFDKEAEAIDLIRKKDFLLMKNFSDQALLQTDLEKSLMEIFKAMQPFFHYISNVLSTDLNGEPIN